MHPTDKKNGLQEDTSINATSAPNTHDIGSRDANALPHPPPPRPPMRPTAGIARPPPPPGPPPRLCAKNEVNESSPPEAQTPTTDAPTPPPPPPRPLIADIITTEEETPLPLPDSDSSHSTAPSHAAHGNDGLQESSSHTHPLDPLPPVSNDVWQEARAPTPPPRPVNRPTQFGALTRAAMTANAMKLSDQYPSEGADGDSQLLQFCSMCSEPYARPPASLPEKEHSTSNGTGDNILANSLNDHSPRMLNCLHSFCASCVFAIFKKNRMSVMCPSCRCITRVGVSGVQGLPVSFQLLRNVAEICGNCESKTAEWRCLNCSVDCSLLCGDCRDAHISMKAFRSHQLTRVDSNGASRRGQLSASRAQASAGVYEMCPKHSGKKREVYCSDCQLVMCLSCAVFDHAGHTVVPIEEGRQLECEQVEQELSVLQHKLEVANVELMDLQRLLLSLDGKKTNIIDTVERLFSGLEDVLDRRESKVLACIEAQYEGKTHQLQTQRYDRLDHA